MGFIANFLENITVKVFWKSANICQKSYERMYSGTVFWLTVYNADVQTRMLNV